MSEIEELEALIGEFFGEVEPEDFKGLMDCVKALRAQIEKYPWTYRRFEMYSYPAVAALIDAIQLEGLCNQCQESVVNGGQCEDDYVHKCTRFNLIQQEKDEKRRDE